MCGGGIESGRAGGRVGDFAIIVLASWTVHAHSFSRTTRRVSSEFVDTCSETVFMVARRNFNPPHHRSFRFHTQWAYFQTEVQICNNIIGIKLLFWSSHERWMYLYDDDDDKSTKYIYCLNNEWTGATGCHPPPLSASRRKRSRFPIIVSVARDSQPPFCSFLITRKSIVFEPSPPRDNE